MKIVQSSRTPSTPINARNQCTRAIRKLDKKLRGDHAVAATVPAPSPGDGSSLLPKALKETAFESARFHEAAERKEVEEITSASAEKQREADTKSSCYFEAHAQALEAFIAFDTQGNEDPASLDDEGGELPRLEYEYRAAGAVANRANMNATTAAKTIQTLTRRLAKITPIKKLVTEVKVPQDITPPHELPSALAERCRERSRSTIQGLLFSYIRRKRGITDGPSDLPPRTVPFAAHPHLPGPSDLPPTSSQESDGQHPQDLDVSMAESTVRSVPPCASIMWIKEL